MSDDVNHDKMVYSYPSNVMADNNYPCMKWSDAMNNDNFKDLYKDFNQTQKDLIANNINSRKCLAFSGTEKCYTVNGFLESCSQLPHEPPQSIENPMQRVQASIDASKEPTLKKLDAYVKQRREKISSLIEQHTTRQNMIKMNKNFKKLTIDNLNDQDKKEVDLINDLNQIDNVKQFTEQDLKIIRDNIKWYEYYNGKIRRIMWYLLIMLIIAIILYMLSLPSRTY